MEKNEISESCSELADKKEKEGFWSALSLAWGLGYTIAIPLIALALFGRILDKRFNTSPWLLLAGIFLSIIISTFAVYYKTVKILNATEKERKDRKK